MNRSAWHAVDAATPLRVRAREVRRAWEQFQADGDDASVRKPIATSWRRSRDAGVDPSPTRLAPVVSDAIEAAARWDVHPLAAAAPVILDAIARIADYSAHLIVVSDAEGVLLWIRGNARTRLDAADSINFTEGALWSEGGAGTNAVGTALAADHPVQVFAGEHFNEAVQRWTCSAAPVHDPDDGRLLGVIDLTGLLSTAHPHSLGVAITAASAVESHLRSLMHDRDARLRSRYEDDASGRNPGALVTTTGRVLIQRPGAWLPGERLLVPPGGGELLLSSGARVFAEPVGHDEAFVVRNLGDRPAARPSGAVVRLNLLGTDRAELEVDGRPVRLSRRHTEILALLATRPDGMTGEELAADLYGDSGVAGTARVQVHRMRKLLAPWIDAEPYRLSVDVESDFAHVQGLLDRGAVREAAEHYTGTLLPHSVAPGIVRERRNLDAWVRQAVMTADDEGALWAWVQTPSGSDDRAAWKRLLLQLDFHDPRRSLAAARIQSLRDDVQQ